MTILPGVWLAGERAEGVRRLGQALWMMIGQPIALSDLFWARGLLGANGDTLLWKALSDAGAVQEPHFVLRPRQLADFLCRLWSDGTHAEHAARLVWTLPAKLAIAGLERDSYVQTVIQVVESANATLTLVSPYLGPTGMGRLHAPLLEALQRGVAVLVLTHDVEDLSSIASASLESLRRESAGLPGELTVFTASAIPQVLLHLKIVVADARRAVVGSANFTSKGFGDNLEAGVLLGPDAAHEIARVIRATIECDLASKAYSGPKDSWRSG